MFLPRFASFVLWAATAATATALVLQRPQTPSALAPATTSGHTTVSTPQNIVALFQAGPAQPSEQTASSMAGVRLLGIIHATQAPLALIQEGLLPARSLGLGAELANGQRIHSIAKRSVVFERHGQSTTLVLPKAHE